MNLFNRFASSCASLFRPKEQEKFPPTDEQIKDNISKIMGENGACFETVVSELQKRFLVSPKKVRNVLEGCKGRPCKRGFDAVDTAVDDSLLPKSKMVKSQRSDIDIEESIKKITKALENGPKTEVLYGKRQLVVCGVTGSGKSTLINSLAGCELRRLMKEEADRARLSYGSLCVKSIDDGGPLNEITKIGNQHGVSCTSQFQAVDLAGMGLCLWDIPGFQDTQGPEINIANAVNLSKLLNASQECGLVALVVLDAQSLEAGRGQAIKKTLTALSNLLSSDTSGQKIQQNLHGILFCITKVCAERLSLETVKQWIIQGAATAAVSLNDVADQIIIYDPLHENKEAASRKVLIERVLMMQAIESSDACLCAPCIAAEELVLIQSIASSAEDRICASLSTENFRQPDIKSAMEQLELFRSLSDIVSAEIPHIEAEKRKIVLSVKSIVQKWEADVLESKDDFTPLGRSRVGFNLEILNQAILLDKECDSPFDHILHSQASQIAKEAEAANQAKRCSDIMKCFCSSLAQFRSALSEHCRQVESWVGYEMRGKSCYDILHDYPIAGSIELKGALNDIDDLAQDLKNKKVYVWGDLNHFDVNVQQSSQVMFRSCVEVTLLQAGLRAFESLISVNAHQIVVAQPYGIENPRVRQLHEQLLTVRDLQLLPDFGFKPALIDHLKWLLDILAGLDDDSIRSDSFASLNSKFAEIHQTAIQHLLETKEKYKEDVRKIIDAILAAGEFERDKFQLKEALHNLKAVDGSEHSLYQYMIKNVQLRLESTQSSGEIATLIKAESYHELVSRYQTFRDLKVLPKF
jgi:hypothetical protein